MSTRESESFLIGEEGSFRLALSLALSLPIPIFASATICLSILAVSLLLFPLYYYNSHKSSYPPRTGCQPSHNAKL